MNRLGTLLGFILTFSCGLIWGQCPTASFNLSPSCAGTPINITNNSINGSVYNWDFCSGELGLDSMGISSIVDSLIPPAGNFYGVTTVFDGTNWFLFATRASNTYEIDRLAFGNSLDNTPVKTRFTGLAGLNQPVGITIFKEGNTWYGITANAGATVSNQIVRLNFGTSLNNVPTSTAITISGINGAREVKAFYENDSLIVIVANGNRLTMVNYGSSILNTVDPSDISVINYPQAGNFWGFDIVKDCGNWWTVITSLTSGRVYRSNLGGVLFDTNVTSTDTLLANSTLYGNGGAIRLTNEGGEFKCFFVSNTSGGRVYFWNFGNSMSNSVTTPAVRALGTATFSWDIANSGTNWYAFYVDVTSASRYVRKFKFANSCSVTPSTSNVFSPAPLSYSANGPWKVALTVQDSIKRFNAAVHTVQYSNNPTANFSNTDSCQSSAVNFLDFSTAGTGSIVARHWSFGNGDTSIVQAPIYVYDSEGTFAVKLKVTNTAGCIDSFEKPINIYEKPEANYNLVAGCEGDTVQFNNTSSFVSLPITMWQWNFGDFNTSNLQYPSHVYAGSGNFSTSLVATNNYGCRDTAFNAVMVQPLPQLSVTVNNDCSGANTLFANNSSIQPPSTIASYLWYFGDGGSSTDINPVHQYVTNGLYAASLSAISSNGCADTLQFNVNIVNPAVANFSFTRACEGSVVNFTDLSQPNVDIINAYKWHFGDGDSSVLQNPVHIYNSAGSYQVSICVTTGAGCQTCISKTIQVLPKPIANFSADTVCANSQTLFTDLSGVSSPQNITQWSWNFGDANTSTIQSPANTYVAGGTYNASLQVTTDSQCTAIIIHPITVYSLPVADFDMISSCSGTSVSFVNTSTATIGDTIFSILWAFGDGDTSTINNPTHVYAGSGPYNANLSVTTQRGCIADVTNPAGSLTVNFSVSDSVCEQAFVAVNNQSSGFSSYEWDFCSGELNLDSVFLANTILMNPPGGNMFGQKTIYDGSNWFTFLVRNTNPSQLWRVDYGNNLNNSPTKTQVSYTGATLTQSTGIEIFKEGNNWYGLILNGSGSIVRVNFGNNLANSIPTAVTIANPFGLLNVPRAVKAVNDNDSLVVVIANGGNEKIVLLNYGNSILNTLDASDTLTVNIAGATGFSGIDIIRDCDQWYTLLMSVSSGQLHRLEQDSVLFDTSYTHTMLLNNSSLYGGGGDVKVVRENGEFKCFFTSPSSGGRIYYTTFGNNIGGTPGLPVARGSQGGNPMLSVVNQGSEWHYLYLNNTDKLLYNYTFWDSCIATTTYSIANDPSSVTYGNKGNMHISLIGRDLLGHIKSTSKVVNIKPRPIAGFGVNNACENSLTCFIDSAIAPGGSIASYVWNFGDGGIATIQSPCHTYIAEGNFNITQVVQSFNGCYDTIQQLLHISEQPTAAFNYTVNCQRDSAIFSDASVYVNDSITSWLWNFAGISSDVSPNTVQFLDTFGTINVSLIAFNTAGCSDTITNSVYVKPKPLYSIQPVNTCVAQPVNFTNNTTVPLGDVIVSTLWQFGDGGTSTLFAPSYQYTGGVADYNAVIYNTLNNGCTDSFIVPIHIATAPAPAFSVGTACQGNVIPFNDMSSGTSDGIFKWIWDFGNGTSDSVQFTSYTYPAPGTYNVTLTVVSPTYCDSSITQPVTIFPAPVVSVGVDTACSGQASTFTNFTTVTSPYQVAEWSWNFGDAESDTVFAPQHIYNSGGTFNAVLTATTDSGCFAADTVVAFVYSTPLAGFELSSSCSGTTVDFTNTTNTVIGDSLVSILWDFGDGDTSSLINPTHTYASSGPYNTTLTVVSQYGCSSSVSHPAGSLAVDFIANDSVCEGAFVGVNNLSTGFTNYDWDFCSGELSLDSIVFIDTFSMANPGGNMFGMKTVFDGSNWATFLLRNTNPAQLWRVDYGNDLNNTPTKTQVAITGVTLTQPIGLEIFNEAGVWYGLVINSSGNLVRLNFGPSLSANNITAVSTANPYGLITQARSIKAIVDNDSLVVAITNGGNDKIVYFNYGSSILNTIDPSDTLTVELPGAGGFWGIDILKDCDQWYSVAVSLTTGRLYRINHGNSLFSTSYTSNLLFSSLALYNNGGDLFIGRENGEYKCFFTSNTGGGRIYYTSFGNSMTLTPSLPVAKGVGNSLLFSVVNKESEWRLLYFNNTSKLIYNNRFYDDCIASPAYSHLPNPGGTYYSSSNDLSIALVGSDTDGRIRMLAKPVTIHPGPNGNFGVDNICFGSSTCFSDSTTLASGSVVSYNWDFGDNGLSSLINPCHLYADTGSYNVTLVTQGSNGCADTLSHLLYITESPIAAFTYSIGCQRDSALFFDASTFAFDTITNWMWGFGGLSADTLPNSVQFLDTFGTVNVSLVAINSRGCTDTALSAVYINPKPVYDIQVQNTCVGEPVSFINNTTVPLGDFINSTLWSFGDGNTSTVFSPVYQYAGGVADYSATVYNTLNNGCADSFVLPVHVATHPIPDFSVSAVCQGNPLPFIDLSAGTSDTIFKWIWNFGNGVTDTQQIPQYIYTTPGSYNVTLTVVSHTYCDSSITKPVTVLPSPLVSVAADTVCNGIATSFANNTFISPPYNVSNWNWNFGDGVTDVSFEPQHIYIAAGSYNAVLTATSDSGCYASDTLGVYVNQKPDADFTPLNVSCADVPTVLQNLTTIQAPGQVVNYAWNFGDGATETIQSPVHTFAQQNSYTVQLIAVSNLGCADTVAKTVEVFAPLIANFNFTGVCLGDTTKFTDLTPSLSIVSWNWNFGDNFTAITQNPTHKYSVADTFNVRVRVENAIGCIDTFSADIRIVEKPVADFENLVTCINAPYLPQDLSAGVSEPINSWQWEVNNNIQNIQAPVFMFSDTGDFNISLIVAGESGCVDSVAKIVSVKPLPVALFTYSPLYGEAPVNVTFNNESIGGTIYDWRFGDGDFSSDDNPVHTYTNNDTFVVTLITQSQFGCADTFSNSFIAIPTDLDIAVTDVTTERLTLPDGSLSIEVRVKFANVGTRIITSVRLFATLGGGSIIVEDWSGLLNTGQITTHTLAAKFVVTEAMENTYVCVEAKEVNAGETEIRTDNNRACKTLDGVVKIVGPSPNPSEGYSNLGIILPQAGPVSIAIVSELGNYVMNEITYDLPKGRTDIELPVTSLQAAIYYIRIKYLDDTMVKKLVVKK